MDRRHLLGAAAILSTIAPAHADTPTNPRVFAERFAATLSAHDMAASAELFAADYVNHQTSASAPPPPPGVTAKAGTVGFFGARLAGIPDLKVEIEALVADGETVAASFVYSGTHGGTYFGVAPTGRKLRFTSCDIFRIANGKIAEHWGMGDAAGIMAQLKA